jgi:hypothetical protein
VAHGARGAWGLAHICLQPLALLGLAFLASQWNCLGVTWRRVLIAGVALDFVLGIALQFGAQSYLLDHWFAPALTAAESLVSYSPSAMINLRAKSHFKLTYFGDGFAANDTLLLLLLGALLLAALILATRSKSRE